MEANALVRKVRESLVNSSLLSPSVITRSMLGFFFFFFGRFWTTVKSVTFAQIEVQSLKLLQDLLSLLRIVWRDVPVLKLPKYSKSGKCGKSCLNLLAVALALGVGLTGKVHR